MPALRSMCELPRGERAAPSPRPCDSRFHCACGSHCPEQEHRDDVDAITVRSLRRAYRQPPPEQELAAFFDIRRTVLDIRHLVGPRAPRVRRSHGTDLSGAWSPMTSPITRMTSTASSPRSPCRPPPAAMSRRRCRTHLWDREAILASSRPFEGVFGVIRWFQLQPRTHIALNTGRSHRFRGQTLESLNTIGAAYRVRITRTCSSPLIRGADVPACKVVAIEQIERRWMPGRRGRGQRAGEPSSHGGSSDPTGETLYLHADTIFRSRRLHPDPLVVRKRLSPSRVRSRTHPAGPDRIGLARRERGDGNLAQFLTSDVRSQVDVRRDPVGRLVLRHARIRRNALER